MRYPQQALDLLRRANISYRGWIANHRVPSVLARYRCTVHVPRQSYAASLATIRARHSCAHRVAELLQIA
jgi:spore maturation protein CgeB